MTAKKSLFLIMVLVLLLAACGPTPEPQTVVQTVEVEKTVIETVVETVEVEVEKTVVETVVETVEVEVEVPVIETVVVEVEGKAPEQISFAGHQYFNLSFGAAPAPLEDMKARATGSLPWYGHPVDHAASGCQQVARQSHHLFHR